MPDSVLVGAAEVFVVEVRVLVLDHRDLYRDRILGQHRALGTVEAGRHLVALSWFASYQPRRESRLSRSRLRRFFTNNNVGFSFPRLFIIPQDVDVASLILCWWATFIIDSFVMIPQTLGCSALYWSQVAMCRTYHQLLGATNSHPSHSFKLKHLWQRGAMELFSMAQTNIKHVTTFSEIIMHITLIFRVLSSFPLPLTGKIRTQDRIG